MNREEMEMALALAQERYASHNDDIKIYDDARVEKVDEGFWIEARVWISLGDVDEQLPAIEED